MMAKRLADRFGRPFAPEATKWQKLRTYPLTSGAVSTSSRSSALKTALEGTLVASVEAAHEALRRMREEMFPESPHSDISSLLEPDEEPEASSTDIFDLTAEPRPEKRNKTTEEPKGLEERSKRPSISQIINLDSSEDESATVCGAASNDTANVNDASLEEAAAYVRSIPSRCSL
ncbi:hypothetical protein PI124_g11037 [Phytophthora idaei]|nr:hypothetical protein PI125_g5217 [Phytophthora idaei]KAG3163003.1 hypothetical protein PI126_g5758 [Phytophthora idaei]KAG3244164.1 hypothetical protein PI124_g11037 [Phytophthora idaei]